MTATLLIFAAVLLAIGLYSVLLLAVFSPSAYRNGYAAGKREQYLASLGTPNVKIVRS